MEIQLNPSDYTAPSEDMRGRRFGKVVTQSPDPELWQYALEQADGEPNLLAYDPRDDSILIQNYPGQANERGWL